MHAVGPIDGWGGLGARLERNDAAQVGYRVRVQVQGLAKPGDVSSCRKGATAASFCTAGSTGSRRRWGHPDLVAARGHHGKDRLAGCRLVMLGCGACGVCG